MNNPDTATPPTPAEIAVGFALFLAFGGAVYAGLWALLIGRRGFSSWLAYRPRSEVRWNLWDFLIGFICYILLQAALVGWAKQYWNVEPGESELPPPILLAAAAAGALLSVLAASLVTAFRTRSRLSDLGWPGPILRDLGIGVGAYLLIAPPVFLLQGLLALALQPSQHPILRELQANPDPALFAAAAFLAAIAAPVAEEYLFRGMLQGSLESLAVAMSAAARAEAADPLADADQDGPAPVEPDVPPPPSDGESPPPWWPTLLSSALFASLHLHAEIDPDAFVLFFFALGLGYVYRQTRRLLPVIVVHVLLNSTSMAMLAVGIWGAE